MTKNKEKKSVDRILLEDVSPKFQENQAVIDACDSDEKVMRDYVLNHSDVFLDAMNNFFDNMESAKKKYLQETGKWFPMEKEKEYKDVYFSVSKKLNEFYGGK